LVGPIAGHEAVPQEEDPPDARPLLIRGIFAVAEVLALVRTRRALPDDRGVDWPGTALRTAREVAIVQQPRAAGARVGDRQPGLVRSAPAKSPVARSTYSARTRARSHRMARPSRPISTSAPSRPKTELRGWRRKSRATTARCAARNRADRTRVTLVRRKAARTAQYEGVQARAA
jgi:hypothetical protein